MTHLDFRSLEWNISAPCPPKPQQVKHSEASIYTNNLTLWHYTRCWFPILSKVFTPGLRWSQFSKYMNFKMGWFQPPTIVPISRKPQKNTEKIAPKTSPPSEQCHGWSIPEASRRLQKARTDQPTRGVAARSTDPAELTKDTQVLWGWTEGSWWAWFFWGQDLEDVFPWKADGIRQFGGLRFVRFFCWNKMGLAMFFCQKA